MSTISSRKFGRHSTKTSLHTDKDERKSKAGSPSGPTSGHRRRRKSITDNDIGNSLQVPGAKKKGFAMRRKSFKKLIDAKSAEELQQMDR